MKKHRRLTPSEVDNGGEVWLAPDLTGPGMRLMRLHSMLSRLCLELDCWFVLEFSENSCLGAYQRTRRAAASLHQQRRYSWKRGRQSASGWARRERQVCAEVQHPPLVQVIARFNSEEQRFHRWVHMNPLHKLIKGHAYDLSGIFKPDHPYLAAVFHGRTGTLKLNSNSHSLWMWDRYPENDSDFASLQRGTRIYFSACNFRRKLETNLKQHD